MERTLDEGVSDTEIQGMEAKRCDDEENRISKRKSRRLAARSRECRCSTAVDALLYKYEELSANT
jgi:hypothetical protein